MMSEIISLVEASRLMLNEVVKTSQQLPHLNFSIGQVHGLYNMFSLEDTRAGLNLVDLEYHQYVADRKPNFMANFDYFKGMDDMYLLDISGLGGGK